MAASPFLRTKGRGAVLFLLGCSMILSSLCDPCHESALFDFSRPRGGPPPPQRPPPQPRPPGLDCSQGPGQAFCFGMEFQQHPHDVFCNFVGLGEHPNWKNLSFVQGIQLSYREANSICVVNLLRRDGGARFVYDSAECYPELNRETLPPLLLANVQNMTLKLDWPGCFKEEFYLGPAEQTLIHDKIPAVVFNLRDHYCTTVPEYPYFIMGRETSTKFNNDGRRYRPAS